MAQKTAAIGAAVLEEFLGVNRLSKGSIQIKTPGW
jgi:hypothetical protein